MSEKKDKQKESSKEIAWLKGFTEVSLQKASEIDIKPKLTIDVLGIMEGKEVIINSEPYLVEIPENKRVGKESEIWMIDLLYNGIEHTFICQSGSFRFQLGVLMRKLKFKNPIELIGVPIMIWKEVQTINTPTFKGKAEVYQVKSNF